MLKFLTHKLRTQSINEENYIEKIEEDKDSGTESDDEIEPELTPSTVMSSRSSPTYSVCSPCPADFHDAHSSEEELEVINSPSQPSINSTTEATNTQTQTLTSAPEKRKWSQIAAAELTSENEENVSRYGNIRREEWSGSSDEEVHSLLINGMATPVQFRTSPPLEALKPGRAGSAIQPGVLPVAVPVATFTKGRTLSPPPHKVVHYDVSPRKKVRHTRHHHVQRPCLDFEKMQQLKARSVTAWRNSGDHGGELSVFCW